MDLRRNCDWCVEKKVRCDGHPKQACTLCRRKGRVCIFSLKLKPGPKAKGQEPDDSPQPAAPEAISPLVVPGNPPPSIVSSSASSTDGSDSGDSSSHFGGEGFNLGGVRIDSRNGMIQVRGDSGGGGGGGRAAAAAVGVPSAGGGGGVSINGGGGRAAREPKKQTPGKGKEKHVGGGGGLASPSPRGHMDEGWGPGQQLRMPPWFSLGIQNGELDRPDVNRASGGGSCVGGAGAGRGRGGGGGMGAARMGTTSSYRPLLLDGWGFSFPQRGGYVDFVGDEGQQQTIPSSKKRRDPPAGSTTDGVAAHQSKRQQTNDAGVQSAMHELRRILATTPTPPAATVPSLRAQQQQQQQQQQYPQLSRNTSDASSGGSFLKFVRTLDSFRFPGEGNDGGSNSNGGGGEARGSVGSGVGSGEAGTLGCVRGSEISPSLGSTYIDVRCLDAAAPPGPLSPSTVAFGSGTAAAPVTSGAHHARSGAVEVDPVWMPKYEALPSLPQGPEDWTPLGDISPASCDDLLSLVGMPADDFMASAP
eukprot:g11868.t1